MSVFRRDEFVRSVQGQSVPGAEVFVCTQPANATAFPPTPLASIFSDPAGTIPIIQPVITDGFGHCAFYVVAGTYTVVVANNNVIQQIYPDQLIGSNGVGSVSFETNGIANTDQALLNLKDGTEITVTSDGIGGVVIDTNVPIPAAIELQTNSADNTIQTKLNLKNSDGTVVLVSDGAGGVTLSSKAAGIAAPFQTRASGSTTGLNNGTNNTIKLLALTIPYAITFTNMAVYSPSGDVADLNDWGIYDLSGNLLANVGPQLLTSSALSDIVITQGSVTLQAGTYLFAFTSNVTSAQIQVSETNTIYVPYTTITTSSGGTLPPTIVPVAGTITYSTGDLTSGLPTLLLHS